MNCDQQEAKRFLPQNEESQVLFILTALGNFFILFHYVNEYPQFTRTRNPYTQQLRRACILEILYQCFIYYCDLIRVN